MNVLVTGGAGYIGSVAVKQLIEQDYNVVVIDNLSKGKKELVNDKAKLIVGDLTDRPFVEKVFSENKFDAVIHFAGYKAVEESMFDAPKYSQNIIGTITLLDTMVKFNVKQIIFSSSAATYGMPKENPLTEKSETNPINFYGFTKLDDEKIMSWYDQIHNIKFIALRYFNVAGDGGLNYIDPDAKNIFPIIMEYIFGKRDKLKVFGDDYDTPDGTCVRDYIHVLDLVDAHIKALHVKDSHIINLGSNSGFSVKQLIEATEKIIGRKIIYEVAPRREGDPATLIASNKLAKEVLNWKTTRSIDEMISSTYQAYKQ